MSEVLSYAPELESENKDNPEIQKLLEHKTYTDQDGIERQIYTLPTRNGKTVDVVFYSPEELPYAVDIAKGKKCMVLGEKPKFRDEAEWGDFLKNLSSDSGRGVIDQMPQDQWETVDSGEGLLFVESNPTNLLDLATFLGQENSPEKQNLRLATHQRTITPEIRDMIDRIVAFKALNWENEDFNDNPFLDDHEKIPENPYGGELLTVLGFLGNKEATEQLEKMLEESRKKRDEKEKEMRVKYEEASKVEPDKPLSVDDLVLVHTTRFIPKKVEGGYEMKSTFDGTGWELPRQTIHFSCNHLVQSHMYGSWEGTPYVVLSPLRNMIDANGVPANINTVDTYFEVSPGEKLKLPPGSWLVRPGIVEGLIEIDSDNNQVIYDRGKVDIAKMEQYIELAEDEGIEDVRTYLYDMLFDAIKYSFHTQFSSEKVQKITEEQETKLYNLYSKDLDVGAILSEGGFEKLIQEFVAKIDVEVTPDFIKVIQQKMEGIILEEIKKLAIKKQIKQMGFESHGGGMWAWDGDSWDATAATTRLAGELHTRTGPHNGSASQVIEENLLGIYARLGSDAKYFDGEDVSLPVAEAKKTVRQLARSKFDELSDASRRMLYLYGAL